MPSLCSYCLSLLIEGIIPYVVSSKDMLISILCGLIILYKFKVEDLVRNSDQKLGRNRGVVN